MTDAREIIAAKLPTPMREAWAQEIIDALDAAGFRIVGKDEVDQDAENDLLQDILDSRPAINADLPDSYIRWLQAIYSGDFIRAIGRKA